jgi:hypothetical protein
MHDEVHRLYTHIHREAERLYTQRGSAHREAERLRTRSRDNGEANATAGCLY